MALAWDRTKVNENKGSKILLKRSFKSFFFESKIDDQAGIAMMSAMPHQQACPFCNPDQSRVILANSHAFAIFDAFPLTTGHTLIIPKRHIASFFDATQEEQAAMRDLLSAMRQRLREERKPDGFNIGINDGTAAGQTVMHLHMHLIPRYAGDADDPRGGVRWIFPKKVAYWDK